MPSIIVLDNLAQEGLDLLEQAEGIDYVVQTGLKGDALKQALTEHDGAICRSGVKLTDEALDGNTRLKAIVRAGVGTDNIDKTAATRQGIVVMNTPTGNTVSTAEHAFALMLGMSRNLAPANQSLVDGRWDRKSYMGNQLADKTLGIVGLGRIGQEVAARAISFEMRVIGYDPFLSSDRAVELGIEPVANVEEMLPRLDYLTVHTPLTAETENLIGAAQIEMMKPTARLVNCARGGIYNEKALADAINSGRIAGVALDVYTEEPCTDHPLFGLPGVLCTPHLGASTEEAQTQVAIEAVHLLVNFLTRGEIRHAVNMAAVDPKTLDSLRGFLDVSYRLGRFLAQWHDGNITSGRIICRGEVASKDMNLLAASFCAGLVESSMDEPANIVNAKMLLQDRGIEVVAESRPDRGAFSASITTIVETNQGSFKAAGTLFGHDMPRLILLDSYRLEAYLDGVLFIFTHQDVPGIIGKVGTVFGEHDVNIAQMAVGRAGPGEHAVGILNLDGPPPQTAVDAVLGHDHIHRAVVVELPAAGVLPSWL